MVDARNVNNYFTNSDKKYNYYVQIDGGKLPINPFGDNYLQYYTYNQNRFLVNDYHLKEGLDSFFDDVPSCLYNYKSLTSSISYDYFYERDSDDDSDPTEDGYYHLCFIGFKPLKFINNSIKHSCYTADEGSIQIFKFDGRYANSDYKINYKDFEYVDGTRLNKNDTIIDNEFDKEHFIICVQTVDELVSHITKPHLEVLADGFKYVSGKEPYTYEICFIDKDSCGINYLSLDEIKIVNGQVVTKDNKQVILSNKPVKCDIDSLIVSTKRGNVDVNSRILIESNETLESKLYNKSSRLYLTKDMKTLIQNYKELETQYNNYSLNEKIYLENLNNLISKNKKVYNYLANQMLKNNKNDVLNAGQNRLNSYNKDYHDRVLRRWDEYIYNKNISQFGEGGDYRDPTTTINAICKYYPSPKDDEAAEKDEKRKTLDSQGKISLGESLYNISVAEEQCYLSYLTKNPTNLINILNSEDVTFNIFSYDESLQSQIKSCREAIIQMCEYKDEISKKIKEIEKQYDVLVEKQNKEANFCILDKEGNKLYFDGKGELIRIEDKYENYIDIEKDDEYRILSIRGIKDQIKFNYKNGLLDSIIDPLGNKTTFEYNDKEDLIKINYQDGYSSLLSYDNGLSVTDINGSKIVINNTSSKPTVHRYVYKGEISSDTKINNDYLENISALTYSFSEDDRVLSIYEEKTKETKFVYFDNEGKVIKSGVDLITSSYYEGDKLMFESSYYEKDDNIVRSITDESTNTYSIKLSNDDSKSLLGLQINTLDNYYDNENNLSIKFTDLNNNEIFRCDLTNIENRDLVIPLSFINEKDKEINIVFEKDNTSWYKHIDKIELIKLEEGSIYKYKEDNLIKEINQDEVIEYSYNDDNICVSKKVTSKDGKITTVDYLLDSSSRISSIIDSDNNVVEYEYDNKGNCILEKKYNREDSSLVKTNKVSYDEKGNIIESLGKIKDKDNNLPKEVTTYLECGLVESIKNLDGSKTNYTYDKRNGNLLSLSKDIKGVNNSISYIYNYGLLTSVKNHGIKVDYTYDGQGRLLKAKTNNFDYVVLENKYDDRVGVKDKEGKSYEFGSRITSIVNEQVTYVSEKDRKDNLINESKDDGTNKYNSSYIYDNELLTKVIKSKDGDDKYQDTLINTYDESKKITKTTYSRDNKELFSYGYSYNSKDNVRTIDLSIGNYTQMNEFEYNNDNILTKAYINDLELSYDYDVLNRVTHNKTKFNNLELCHEYSYLQQDEETLDLIVEDNVKVLSEGNYLIENKKYDYDVNGKVININIDDNNIHYDYDESGRLIKETNEQLNILNKYTYDKSGNITSIRKYDLKDNSKLDEKEFAYSCDNKNLLLCVNDTRYEYDSYGRPTSIGDSSLEWNLDGSLKSYMNENHYIDYFYNESGIRYKKVIDSKETNYILDGTRILQETTGNNVINYIYHLNKLVGFVYNKDEFIYERNIFGDISRIFNSKGELVGEYLYDAYGNVTITKDIKDIASINPFRYRGYYYDKETKLYYCNARYYDPNICRWISMDSIKYLDSNNINGLNLYAYCNDDPINNVDPSGCFLSALFVGIIIGAIIGAAAGAGVATYLDYKDDLEINGSVGWQTYVGCTLLGGIVGGLAGAGFVQYVLPALKAFAGMSFTIGGGLSISGGAAALTAGVTITGAQILAGAGTLVLGGILVMAAKWVPGSWPGDDPTISPGDGFEWRGQEPVGGDKGAWYNPETGDSLHPDLNHLDPIGPHWDWLNKLREIAERIFRGL